MDAGDGVDFGLLMQLLDRFSTDACQVLDLNAGGRHVLNFECKSREDSWL